MKKMTRFQLAKIIAKSDKLHRAWLTIDKFLYSKPSTKFMCDYRRIGILEKLVTIELLGTSSKYKPIPESKNRTVTFRRYLPKGW